MRTLSLGLISLYAFSAISLVAEDCEPDTPPPPSRLEVGVSVVSILPEVDGSLAYFDGLASSPTLALAPGDPGEDPGVFVEAWDVGNIPIGNGGHWSHWVHDDIRAGAIALKDLDQPEGKTLVLVTVDVYMLFNQDLATITDRVRRQLGGDAYEDLHIVISATHNHMGPDTSGLSGHMNHEYFEYMADQVASAIVDAVLGMESADLKVASSRYQFGMVDSHAPYIADPTLNTLQAWSATDPDRLIATVVQWQNHPEDTLGYGDQVHATPEQAEYLKSINHCVSEDDGATCHIEGQFISAGFPGIAVRQIMAATGAPALYFSGPVGGLLAPLHAYAWETGGPGGLPAGDGFAVPDGAVLIPKNFHKQAVVGDELAKRSLADLFESEGWVVDPPITVDRVQLWGKMTNLLFRAGMALSPTRQPLIIGHLKRELFICPEGGPYDDESCISDGFQDEPDPLLRAPVRVGTYGRTEVTYAQLGPISILTSPAEAFSELVEGLPADFVEDPRGVYYRNEADRHNNVAAEDYDTEGYVRQMMSGEYKWILGLAGDELGYMVPNSNFRVMCVADLDAMEGVPGTCQALFELGIMDYQDFDGQKWSMSGARCRQLRADPSVLEGAPYSGHPMGAEWARRTCYYGQTMGQVDGHYEETLSSSWDMASEWIGAAKALTGFEGEPEDVNPAFTGYNQRD